MSELNHNAMVKSKLEALQKELNERLVRIEEEQKERNTPDNDLWSDQAALHERDDEQFAIRVQAQATLNQVNEALSRLEQGEYGFCEICGEDIEVGRLEALPFATRCLKHADQ